MRIYLYFIIKYQNFINFEEILTKYMYHLMNQKKNDAKFQFNYLKKYFSKMNYVMMFKIKTNFIEH